MTNWTQNARALGAYEAQRVARLAVTDALAAVDAAQAAGEYEPAADLHALRGLADAVRRDLASLVCAWCGGPARLDGCASCGCTALRLAVVPAASQARHVPGRLDIGADGLDLSDAITCAARRHRITVITDDGEPVAVIAPA